MPVQIEGLSDDAWATQIRPPQVDVLLTLRTVTQRLELERLPVQVLVAPGEIGSWNIEIDESDRDLVGVMVEGPVESIQLLRDKKAQPRAFVQLTFEDLERGIKAKPAQIMNLPPGCRVVSPERLVGFQIRRSPTISDGATPE